MYDTYHVSLAVERKADNALGKQYRYPKIGERGKKKRRDSVVNSNGQRVIEAFWSGFVC